MNGDRRLMRIIIFLGPTYLVNARTEVKRLSLSISLGCSTRACISRFGATDNRTRKTVPRVLGDGRKRNSPPLVPSEWLGVRARVYVRSERHTTSRRRRTTTPGLRRECPAVRAPAPPAEVRYCRVRLYLRTLRASVTALRASVIPSPSRSSPPSSCIQNGWKIDRRRDL